MQEINRKCFFLSEVPQNSTQWRWKYIRAESALEQREEHFISTFRVGIGRITSKFAWKCWVLIYGWNRKRLIANTFLLKCWMCWCYGTFYSSVKACIWKYIWLSRSSFRKWMKKRSCVAQHSFYASALEWDWGSHCSKQGFQPVSPTHKDLLQPLSWTTVRNIPTSLLSFESRVTLAQRQETT